MKNDYLDYVVVWLPLCCALTVFFLIGLIVRRSDERLGRFEKFTRIFLSEGATIKNWGLFLSALTLALLLSGIIAMMANDPSWMMTIEVQYRRIDFFKWVAIGLEILLSIVLGAFGAVAFKGQGPGGTSFEMKQDASGASTARASAPAPVVPTTETEGDKK
jgi:hypothetical protein